jgi:HAD superfamily 5'-nucleotidase-like hydrolase
MDRHKYVKVAFHGFQKLTREERQTTYGSTLSRESYDEPDYALIDTLFSLAEAYLFMQLVDFRDQFPGKIPSGTEVQCADGSVSSPNYAQMYKDVRAAVDLCHRDGTLKQAVAHEPSKYINEDRQLVPLLKMLRQSGRLTFLVTNR